MIMIMIIKSIKFTNVISYHKPQFKLQWDSVRVMLVNGLSYWIICHVHALLSCTLLNLPVVVVVVVLIQRIVSYILSYFLIHL